jgi:hypothetical protein
MAKLDNRLFIVDAVSILDHNGSCPLEHHIGSPLLDIGKLLSVVINKSEPFRAPNIND